MIQRMNKRIALLLILSLCLSMVLGENVIGKKKIPALPESITLQTGSKKLIKITSVSTNSIKKTTWKSSSKKLKLSSQKKNSVNIKGVSVGTGKLTAKVILKNSKTYHLVCKVKISTKHDTTPTVTTTVTPTVTPTVAPIPTATEIPTSTADTSKETEAPTNTPAATATPTPTPTPRVANALNADSVKDAYQKYFKMGAAINGTSPSVSTAASPEMRQVMEKHFNSTTLSNLMKPVYLLDQTASQENSTAGYDDLPALKFDSIVDNMEFCKQSGIKMRGHVLVWHSQTPDWFFRKGFSQYGDYVDKSTMQKRMESYIKQVIEYCQINYPGVIYCWDVVNEAVDTTQSSGYRASTWYNIIGKEFVEDAFIYARKYADKGVSLFYNDYNTFEPAKTDKILEIITPLKQAGILNGVGMQGYLNSNWPGVEPVKTAIEKFAAADLEIQLTELTYRVPDYTNVTAEDYEQQGKNYEELMRMLVSQDTAGGGTANITAVTFFGLIDNPYSVFGQNPKPDQDCWARLFDQNFQMKPAYYGVMNALK